MAGVTIRNLPDATHRALKLRAARNNRGTEAEMRAILEAAVLPEGRVGIGTQMAEISRRLGITREDIEALEAAMEEVRDRRPAEPMTFD